MREFQAEYICIVNLRVVHLHHNVETDTGNILDNMLDFHRYFSDKNLETQFKNYVAVACQI